MGKNLWHSRRSRKRNRDFVNSWRARGCEVCEEKRVYMIDAHHTIEQLKEHEISKLARDTYSIKVIAKELSRCIRLCKNHHAEHHHYNPPISHRERGYAT